MVRVGLTGVGCWEGRGGGGGRWGEVGSFGVGWGWEFVGVGEGGVGGGGWGEVGWGGKGEFLGGVGG